MPLAAIASSTVQPSTDVQRPKRRCGKHETKTTESVTLPPVPAAGVAAVEATTGRNRVVEFLASGTTTRAPAAYHYSNELRSLEHPELIRDLAGAVRAPNAMAAAMRARRRRAPAVFTFADWAEHRREESPRFHHGSALANLRSMQAGGIGFGSGEDGIDSGFYLTINYARRAEGYGEASVRRRLGAARETEDKKELLAETQPGDLTPAHAEVFVAPTTRVVDLSAENFRDNRAYEWFERQIDAGRGRELLAGVVTPEFLDKYFSGDDSGFYASKQVFAMLFGADAVIVSPKYENRRFDELVLLDPSAVDRIELREWDDDYALDAEKRLRRDVELAENPAGAVHEGDMVADASGRRARVIDVMDDRIRVEALNGASSWILLDGSYERVDG